MMIAPNFSARVRLPQDLGEGGVPYGVKALQDDLNEDADRRLRLAAIDLKWRLFEVLRQNMEGKVPTFKVPKSGTAAAAHFFKAEGSLEATTCAANGLALDPLGWHKVLYISITYPLDDPKGFVPPLEVADKSSAMFWIAAKLNEEWGTKPKLITTLQSLTRLAAVVRRKGETNPVIPLAFFDQYQKMDEAERHAFLRQWFSWVSHGDSYTEDAHGVCRPGPDASFTLTARGKTSRAAVVFDVSPLYLNLDKGGANYLVRVGLPWEGDLGSPDTWSDDERRAMWEALFRSFEALAGYYQNAAPLPEHIEVTHRALMDMPQRPEHTVATVLSLDSILDAEWEAAKKTIVPPAEAADAVSATSLPTNDNRPLFPVALGHVPIDSEVLSIIQHAGQLQFPRRWSTIPRWSDLARDEVQRLLQEYGHAAFRLRGDAPPLLVRKPVRGQPESQWPTELSPDAVLALKLRHGPKGYLMVDQSGSENFCKCVQRNGEILLEMQVSWHGLAGPFVHDWRERMVAAVEEERLRLESNRLPLFENLDAKDLAKLDGILQNVTLYARGQQCMEVIIGQVAMQGRTTVEIRADVFRTLFWPNGEPPQNWKRDVEAILNALRKIDIVIRSGGRKHMGGFLYSIETEDDQGGKPDRGFRYIGRGPGAHGDGFYQLRVNEAFIGCLRVFEMGVGSLRGGGTARLLNFQKTLDKAEKETLQGGYARVHNGTPLFSASAAHSPFQVNLVRFIERNITLKRDAIAGSAKGPRAAHKVKDRDLEAALPREYDANFCPLLPAGQKFVAALGHFKGFGAPESGWTLYGTKTSAREKAGARPGGIIEKIGRDVPRGNAHKARQKVMEETLADFRRVVVDDFGGVVVGRLTEKERTDGGDGPLWFPLDRFRELDDRTLGHKLKVFIFLPIDWEKRRQEAFEEKTGYRVTDKPAEAETAAWGGEADVAPLAPGEVSGPDNGWRGLTLPARLFAAMKHRRLRQKDVARIFGVTDGQVTRWLAPARGETDAAKVARIPDDMGALMLRWIETGVEPEEGALDALESRHRSPARRLKN